MGNEWQEWESGLLNKLVTHGKPNMDDAFPSRQFDLEPILRQAMSAPRSLLL